MKDIKLLVSAIDVKESLVCIKAGVDIVDIKNPKEGSLGGHTPVVVKKIKEKVPRGVKISAAIGDCQNKPGLVSQASVGLALCGVDYVKVGLFDSFGRSEALYFVKCIVDSVKSASSSVKVVICAYADAKLHGTIEPRVIPGIVREAGADVAMIDTYIKGNGKGLFDFLSLKEITNFKNKSSSLGLKVALAGNLKNEDIILIRDSRLCDIVGIRTLACENRNRNGKVNASSIGQIKKILIT